MRKGRMGILSITLVLTMILTLGDSITYAADISLANPVYDVTQDMTRWSYVYFGSYPQTEVTDNAVITAIESVIKEEDEQSSGNQADTGRDVWVNGIKYSRISKDDTGSDKNFGGSTYRYFKWERIKWKVLSNDGNTLFVVADKALDCKCYNEKYADVTWEDCTLRSWLNNSFYNMAFSTDEQNAIKASNIVNDDNSEYNTEGGKNTNDKIYLLSVEEVTNESYGFCSDYSFGSESRYTKATDYANVRGVSGVTAPNQDYEGNCSDLWLRSPGSDGLHSAFVNYQGIVNMGGVYIGYSTAFCPVLHIDLSSGLWFTADDGTSGNGGEDKMLVGIQASKTKTVYQVGETLNVEDLKVTAFYQTDTGTELKMGDYTTNAAGIDMKTSGRKTLTIAYTEGGITKTFSISITVNQKSEETAANQNETSKAPAKGVTLTDTKTKAAYKVTVSDTKNAAVQYIKSTNTKAAAIIIPATVTINGITYKVASIAPNAFKNNQKITKVTIGSNITLIGKNAFRGCKKLKAVTIGKNVKTIGENAFYGCIRLKTVSMGKNIISINSKAFYKCTALTKITIPSKVTKVGKQAFYGCKRLKSITIKTKKLTSKKVGSKAFKGIYSKVTVKVPKSKLKNYKKILKAKGVSSKAKIKK